MSQNARRPSPVAWFIFGILGLFGLLYLVLVRNGYATLIMKTLQRLGISEQTAKYWVAVSAFETASGKTPWASRVFKDSNNLFCIIVPGSKRLQYGEGQTIFENATLSIDGAEGLYQRVLKPFKYPAHVSSIDALVDYMKSKSYFTSDKAAYLAGVKLWYSKLFPNG